MTPKEAPCQEHLKSPSINQDHIKWNKEDGPKYLYQNNMQNAIILWIALPILNFCNLMPFSLQNNKIADKLILAPNVSIVSH